jgi:DNA-binding response OmpR family regulator
MESLQEKRILVIDDEPDLLSLVSLLLHREGAQVFTAMDGNEGLQQLHETHPDLVLLDIMMPGLTGLETCTRITETTQTPVIFLSVLSNANDIVNGLNRGALDYVTKPFIPKVLVARINAALRFIDQMHSETTKTDYSDGYLNIDLGQRRVTVKGVAVQLTITEFNLLSYLFMHADRVLPFADILENIWGTEFLSNVNYVHIYVWRLRQKIEKNPRQPEYLLREQGIGYRFEKHPEKREDLN